MRGNELPVSKRSNSWGDTWFTIPMRGNESVCVSPSPIICATFTIPMRGNETGTGVGDEQLVAEFTIPMRGNELELEFDAMSEAAGLRSP